jgi:hypothetical protein
MANVNRFNRRRLLGLAAAAGASSVLLPPAGWAFAGVQTYPGVEYVMIVSGGAGSRAHFYPGVSAMPAHGIGAPDGVKPEFFDSRGSRLVPVFDEQGRLTGVRDSGDGADPDAVIDRLRAVVHDMERTIREDPARIASLKITPEEALARLPRLGGVDIDTAFQRGREVFGHQLSGGHGIEHSADPWHNFWVHGIF